MEEKKELDEHTATEEALMDTAVEEEKEAENTVIIDVLSEISEKVEALHQLFTQKIQRTSYEEEIINRMHVELQRYKDDLYAQLLRPLLQDIIEVRESIRRMSDNYALKVEEERVVPLKIFSDYSFDLGDILEKNHVVIFDSKEGDDFIALKQRAVKQVFTSEQELHGKIAKSFSSGYEYKGKVFSPEKVAVYIYRNEEFREGEGSNG